MPKVLQYAFSVSVFSLQRDLAFANVLFGESIIRAGKLGLGLGFWGCGVDIAMGI